MILYLDTSALVKSYIREPGSKTIEQSISTSAIVSTSSVAYPETMAAFGRAKREDRIDQSHLDKLTNQLSRDWNHFLQIKVGEHLIEEAGKLAIKHQLRGFDSIHLASALILESETVSLEFACYDQRLNSAAEKLGIDCIV